MAKTVCFGEILLRLTPGGNNRFTQTYGYNAIFGGGEANVAISLANMGAEASFITAVPDNEIGIAALNELNTYGVDTSNCLHQGDRLGIYFLEKGASQRGAKVLYDRKNSSITSVKFDDFDWDKIFENADWFHTSGITPALCPETAKITIEACKLAKQKGLTVSHDVNYRKKLWTLQQAAPVISEVLQYVDVAVTSPFDAENFLGITADEKLLWNGQHTKESLEQITWKIREKYKIDTVAFTMRRDLSADDNYWESMLDKNGVYCYSKGYKLHIIDRVGGGDSFSSGLIYALKKGFNPQMVCEFATAASALKHSIIGDFNLVSEGEVLNVIDGNSTGRIDFTNRQ